MDIDYRQEGSPVKGVLVGLFASFLFVACWCIVGALFGSGCVSQDGSVDRTVVTNAIHVVKDIVVTVREKTKKESSDKKASEKLVFRYGGFHGENAVEDKETQIGNVRFTRDSVTHTWTKGDLSNWGLARGQADAVACAFFWSDEEQAWIGAKFEWTSTSRTKRSLENLNGGYGGWDAQKFHAAERKAYCIFSKDGRRRTNLAEDGK